MKLQTTSMTSIVQELKQEMTQMIEKKYTNQSQDSSSRGRAVMRSGACESEHVLPGVLG